MVKSRVLQILYTLAVVLAALVLVSCVFSAESPLDTNLPRVTDVRASLNGDSTAVDVTWTAHSNEATWGVYVAVKNGKGEVVASSTLKKADAQGIASIPIPSVGSEGGLFTVSVSLISAGENRALLSTGAAVPILAPLTGRTAPGAVVSVEELERSVLEVESEAALSYPWTWELTLGWTAPAVTGTATDTTPVTISTYDLYWAGSTKTLSTWNYDGKVSVRGDDTLTATLKPLSATLGTYNVMIVATNSAGLTSTTMAGSYNAPTPPAAVEPTLTADSESTSITVSWAPPANAGTTNGKDASTISAYAVVYGAGGIHNESQLTRIAGADTRYIIEGLRAGFEYEVAVYAYNALGLRSDFNPAKIVLDPANEGATPPAALPAESVVYAGAPVVRYTANDKSEIVLMWNLPVDHALGTTDGATPAELTGFVIEYNKLGESPTEVVLSSPSEYTTPENSEVMFDLSSISDTGGLRVFQSSYQYTIKGLETGLYSVSISLLNNAGLESGKLPVGMGDAEYDEEGEPPYVVLFDATLPAPITNVRLTPGDNSLLQVEWDVPADNTFGSFQKNPAIFSAYGIAYAAVNDGAIDYSTLTLFLVENLRQESDETPTRTSVTLPFLLVPNTEYVVAVRAMGIEPESNFPTIDIRIPPYTAFGEGSRVTMLPDNSISPEFAPGELEVKDLFLVDERKGLQVTWPAITPGAFPDGTSDGTIEDLITEVQVSMTLVGSTEVLFFRSIPGPIIQDYTQILLDELNPALIGKDITVAVEAISAYAAVQNLPGITITKQVSLKAYVAPTLSVKTTPSYTNVRVDWTTEPAHGILGAELPLGAYTISWQESGSTGAPRTFDVKPGVKTYTIESLSPGIDYTIEVTNLVPTFDVSQTVSVTTLGGSKIVLPIVSDISLFDAITTSDPVMGIRVLWDATAGKLEDGTVDPITSFAITLTNGTARLEKTVAGNERSLQLTMLELQPFIVSDIDTTFTVVATSNAEITARASIVRRLHAYTKPDFELTRPVFTDNSITVKWIVKNTGTGILGDKIPLTGITVKWGDSGAGTSGTSTEGEISLDTTNYTIRSPITSASYKVTVQISNDIGTTEQTDTYTSGIGPLN